MAVTSTQVTVGTTGATALVAPAITLGAGSSYSETSSAGTRNVFLSVGATGAYIGGSASTSVTGATATQGLPVTSAVVGPIPLKPTEGLYGVGTAASTIGVLVTGG